MKERMLSTLKSEGGADTIEVIIGIVVFVIFGLAVFGMITNAAGHKSADIANCFRDSGTIIKNATGDTDKVCKGYDSGKGKTYTYNQ